MNPDKYQQAWQEHSSQTRVTIDADLLLQEVQRNQRDFRAMIFLRDFREVVVALLMIPVWFYLGAITSSPWTWYLTVPVLVWMAGFMLVYRMRHPQKPSEPNESLLECVKNSLTQVEDQIWLLRNVFWWYLLPPGVSILAFFAHVSWQSAIETNDWLAGLGTATFLFAFVIALYYWIYRLNQRAVDSQLEPHRHELFTLLASLREETTGQGAGDPVCLPSLPFARDSHRASFTSPTRIVVSLIAASAGVLLIVALVKVLVDTDPYVFTGEGYPKRSPFTAVRWQESEPQVKVGGEWFKLVSLDEIATADIVAFSQQIYGTLWRKRFEEDLVELLTRMGHPPQDTVTLVVQSLTSSETRTLEGVAMTYANRRAIRDAAQARERSEQPQGMRRAVPIDDADTAADLRPKEH